MANPRHDQQTTSSRTTLAILTVGGVLVAALIGWALTRTVEPESPIDTTSVATATTPPVETGYLATDTTVTAPAPPPGAPQAEGDRTAVTRIAAEDLRAKLNRGEVTVLDVRDAAAYAREHIPGALNMPFATLEGQIGVLPKGKPIITYCT